MAAKITEQEARKRGYHACYFPKDKAKCELCIRRFDCMHIRFDIPYILEKIKLTEMIQ